MSMTSLTCTRCHRAKMTCDITGATDTGTSDTKSITFLMRCKGCNEAMLAVVDPGRTSAEDFMHYQFYDFDYMQVLELLPAPFKPDVPAGVSPPVARMFAQAEDNRARKHREPASIMYRKTIETSLKDFGTDSNANLKTRIDKLVAANRLTADLGEWAHAVRLIGNEAAHQDDEPDTADVDDLAHFTRMLLVYLFEMPMRVRAMRERRSEG